MTARRERVRTTCAVHGPEIARVIGAAVTGKATLPTERGSVNCVQILGYDCT